MIANSGIVLKDGTLVVVREYAESDLSKFKEFIHSISDSAIIGRFMQNIPRDRAIELLLGKDIISVIALRDGKIIAHGALYEKVNDIPEMGILVDERYQSLGLGTAVLGLMAEQAVRSGAGEIVAYVSPENYKMIAVLKSMGFAVESEAGPGSLKVRFSPSSLPEAIRNFENREAISAVNAVKLFLEPKSVAVIGASSNRSSIGGQLFFNLLESNFQGQIFPVNPSHDFVQGIRAYKSVKDIDFPVEMALIVVPAESALRVIEECGEKGVKGLVIITSGFSEVGEEGKKRQDQLTEICDRYGMRVIGPNCMGVVNNSEEVRLNGQFSPFKPVKGRVSFLSQSGALGIAVFDITTKLGLGLSSFVSVGNKMDISGNDLIQYWENDKNTDVILLYLESFGNPVKFSQLSRRITKKKPIVVVKSGRGSAGFRATQSHTAALLSASDVTVDALFKQSGIVRCDTLDEMFNVTSVLAHQPVPKGNRIAILTNAGGAGILAADACESHGLVVPDLSENTKKKLREILPSIASVRNPVDMTAGIGPDAYSKALEILGSTDQIDSIVVIFILPGALDPNEVARNIIDGTKKGNNAKTVVSVFMGTKGISEILKGDGISIPSFPFPEDAAISLSKAAEYGKWRYAPARQITEETGIDKESVKAIISKALRGGREWLSYNECNLVLNTYKIPTIKTATAIDPVEVKARIQGWEGKVAIKAYGPKLIHKSDVGAVKLNIPVAEAPEEANSMIQMLNSKGFAVDYLVVQEMVSDGIEMIAGSTHDPAFGPMVVAGMGGKLVELLKDISTRLAPIDREDADQMISELRTAKILEGYRGGIVADEEGYKDVIVRISHLVYDNPEIVELDLNPVMVLEKGKGTKTVDFRIRVANISQNTTPFVAKSVIRTTT